MTDGRSDALVFFGATGDLAYKKIFPALQAMVKRGHLDVPVIGVAKAGWGIDELRARARDSVEQHGGLDAAAIDTLCGLLRYVDGDYRDPATFQAISQQLGAAERPAHYLAIPPTLFGPVVEQLGRSGRTSGARVIVEKPFGRDLASARNLNRTLFSAFDENTIFRIDHYLGKRPVYNMLFFRLVSRSDNRTGSELLDVGIKERCQGRRGSATVEAQAHKSRHGLRSPRQRRDQADRAEVPLIGQRLIEVERHIDGCRIADGANGDAGYAQVTTFSEDRCALHVDRVGNRTDPALLFGADHDDRRGIHVDRRSSTGDCERKQPRIAVDSASVPIAHAGGGDDVGDAKRLGEAAGQARRNAHIGSILKHRCDRGGRRTLADAGQHHPETHVADPRLIGKDRPVRAPSKRSKPTPGSEFPSERERCRNNHSRYPGS